jgi:MCP family monocarboxylic acid transporter-like MFS transporter 10
MGIAFSIVGISLLLGTPIEGALLQMRSADDGFLWFGSIIFCGVGLSHSFL